MAHPDFLFWMIGFPIFWAISSWTYPWTEEKCGDGTKVFIALFALTLWLGVGWALW